MKEWTRISKTAAKRIREIRRAQGLTQGDLADRLRAQSYPGMEQPTVAKKEAGDRHLSLEDVLAIAFVLNVSPLSLLSPHESDATCELTPNLAMDAATFRAWVRRASTTALTPFPAKFAPEEDQAAADKGIDLARYDYALFQIRDAVTGKRWSSARRVMKQLAERLQLDAETQPATKGRGK